MTGKDPGGLWSAMTYAGHIRADAWDRAVATGEVIGVCRNCGEYLVPDDIGWVDDSLIRWFTARCLGCAGSAPPRTDGCASAGNGGVMDGRSSSGAASHELTWAQRFADAVWQADEQDLDIDRSTDLAGVHEACPGWRRSGVDDAAATHARTVQDRQCLDCRQGSPDAGEKGLVEPVDVFDVRGGRATVYRLLIPGSVPECTGSIRKRYT